MIRPRFRQTAVPWKTIATQTRASGENRVSTKPGVLQGGADGDGLAGADLAGDDADGAFGDAPGDAGDGFVVGGVAVQHAGGQVAADRRASPRKMTAPSTQRAGSSPRSWPSRPAVRERFR